MSTTNRIHPQRNTTNSCEEGVTELRRGPWTLEEDNLLIQYISCHGEGRWNSLAKSSGLNRTGKSCRLRWLNYLKPDIKRGNLTPQEQLLILELHSKWGNRWSKIAQHLPGRTDNEIKNYWRTRVQKQARQLKVDSNSDKFLEAIRTYWMPRLVEKMEQNSSSTSSPASSSTVETQKLRTAPPCFPNQEYPEKMVTNSSPMNGDNHEYDMQCYHVGIPPSAYDMQMQVTDDQCHVGDIDWFGEDIGSTFWNTDELWQFRKPEEVVLGV